MEDDVRAASFAAAQFAARASYGRLLAFTARRTQDFSGAEDALSEAFLAALETWPRSGVPANPDAWLLTAARRKLIDVARQAQTASRLVQATAESTASGAGIEPALQWLIGSGNDPADVPPVPDERLHMLFLCAHPAIARESRTPLMLQAVLGLDAARIASAFLVAPGSMSQRLVRAKRRIAATRMSFDLPDIAQLPERLDAVLEAIYAAYGTGWDDPLAGAARARDLTGEALFLARLLAGLLPQDGEVLGLLALLLHCEARSGARRDADGRYVPLSAQDPQRWSRPLIVEAQAALDAASRCLRNGGRLGHFQLEAAIQSVHAQRAQTGQTNWLAIAQLYDGLARMAPTLGARVARAGAHAEAFGPAAGLAALAALEDPRDPQGVDVRAYQPFFAVRAHLHAQTGAAAAALADYNRAIGLSQDPAIREFLAGRAAALVKTRPA